MGLSQSLAYLRILLPTEVAFGLEPVRLLLAGLPPMVARFLADAIAGRADVLLLGNLLTLDELGEVIARAGANIVVVGTDGSEKLADQLLSQSCRLVLLSVSTSGDRACIYAQRARPRYVSTLTAPELLDEAVRALGSGDE